MHEISTCCVYSVVSSLLLADTSLFLLTENIDSNVTEIATILGNRRQHGVLALFIYHLSTVTKHRECTFYHVSKIALHGRISELKSFDHIWP